MTATTIAQLLRERASVRDELRTILSADELTTEMQARATELENQAAALEVTERRLGVLADLDRRAEGRPLDTPARAPGREVRMFADRSARVPDAFDGQIWRAQDGSRVPVLEARHRMSDFLIPDAVPTAASEIGLGAFLRCLRFGPRTEVERRAMGEASIGAGGALLPTPLSLEVIDLMRPQNRAFQAGARTIPMTTATLRFARQDSDPVGSWRSEASSIALSAPTFDNLVLNANTWALMVIASRELLEDATNIDAQLSNVFAKVGARALDEAILSGSGTANQPLGIENTSGIQTISLGTNGAALTGWTPFLDAALALETANAGAISAAIMHPRTSRVLNGLVDSLGQPLRPPPRIANVPLLVTTGLSATETQGTATTASSILLGDFSTVYVGMKTELQVTILHERYADSGQVGFCLWMRADVQLAHPAAMARIEGIIPAS